MSVSNDHTFLSEFLCEVLLKAVVLHDLDHVVGIGKVVRIDNRYNYQIIL